MEEMFGDLISRLAGIFYTLCWSISFYPQAWSNYRRRSTEGFLPDYPLLNLFGFSSFTASTAVLLLSDSVRAQYAARHPLSPEPTVRWNDLVFGAHALALVIITYSQFWPRLWGWEGGKGTGGARKAKKVSVGLVWGCMSGVAIVAILVVTRRGGSTDDLEAIRGWQWLDVIYSLSYVKLLLTVFKYIPQVLENHRRRSTVGWSIWQVLLDFAGGILSLLQLVLDSARQNDWSGLTGNPAKLGLANISILFDIVFMLQHYVLYRDREETGKADDDVETIAGSGERAPLLSSRPQTEG